MRAFARNLCEMLDAQKKVMLLEQTNTYHNGLPDDLDLNAKINELELKVDELELIVKKEIRNIVRTIT